MLCTLARHANCVDLLITSTTTFGRFRNAGNVDEIEPNTDDDLQTISSAEIFVERIDLEMTCNSVLLICWNILCKFWVCEIFVAILLYHVNHDIGVLLRL